MIFRTPIQLIVSYLLLYSAIAVGVEGCTKYPDLSSPEKNHEAIIRAFRTKDFDLWLKCFQDEDKIRKEFIRIGGTSHFQEIRRDFFEKNHLLESTILEKSKISESEVTLKIKDVIEKKPSSGTRSLVKSIYLAKYIKIGSDWKVHSTEEVDVKFFKWLDGKYVPLESNKFKK
jgi:hypothetical protein